MIQTVAWMRLPRRLLPLAPRIFSSQPRKLLPVFQSWQHSRYITSQEARPLARHPARFDEDLEDLYSEDYINFYDKNIAGNPVHDPFQNLNEEYPRDEDYHDPNSSNSAYNVSCTDFYLSRKATGSIRLRIYNASNRTSRSPVIIYFPSRGTNPITNTNEHRVISLLTNLTRGTTISVGYRVSPPFPLSLHDALAAVDWARSNIPTVSLGKYCENGYDGRLMAVLGTGIGGSLATSIGTTEGRESGIIAVGAWLPIVDWAFDPLPGIPESSLSTLPRSLASLKGQSQSNIEEMDPDVLSTYSELADTPFLTSKTLKTIRSQYLATPEDSTDPFASPLYRFSSSGVNIWTRLVSQIESELLADPENPPSWIKRLPSAVFKRGPRRPISYPPLDMIGKLTVPMMRIVSAESDILHQQITEYVHAARSSMFPYENRTFEDIAKEEARELERTHTNDIEEPEARESEAGDMKLENAGQDDTTKEFSDDEREARKSENTDWDSITEVAEDNSPEEPKYGKGAEFNIQHEIIPKAGHCLITGAGEITDGIKEVEKMAEWINSTFASEPNRAQLWKIQQELWERASMEARAKKSRWSKL